MPMPKVSLEDGGGGLEVYGGSACGVGIGQALPEKRQNEERHTWRV